MDNGSTINFVGKRGERCDTDEEEDESDGDGNDMCKDTKDGAGSHEVEADHENDCVSSVSV